MNKNDTRKADFSQTMGEGRFLKFRSEDEVSGSNDGENGVVESSGSGDSDIPHALGVAGSINPLHLRDKSSDGRRSFGVVGGGNPTRRKTTCRWQIENGARRNYSLLGKHLAHANASLYRNGTNGPGLILVQEDHSHRLISKGAQLVPVIADSPLRVRVTKEGKLISELPATAHLEAALRSIRFLQHFRPVDCITKLPRYRDDFSPVEPGYNDGSEGSRVLYLGNDSTVSDDLTTINAFLDAMAFASEADRTNTVAAALTVLLRHQFPGEKPIVLITATKSHAGKGTITEFMRGGVPKADVLYENLDWPMQLQFQRQINLDREIGVVVFDNVRLDSSGSRTKFIRSAFIESFVTTPELILAAPGVEAVRIKNNYVVTINSNDGALSADLLNRSLSIYLAPKGNPQDRPCSIGNPKLEFLPQNRTRIEAELRGLIHRWKIAGCPLDDTVRHSMSPWARTVGGILKVSGFQYFLANSSNRKTADDPIREALAILAAAQPGKAMRPAEWATLAVKEGLARTLFSPNERDTERGRERAIGVLLSRHLEESILVKTETSEFTVRLEGGVRRWMPKQNPHSRYIFTVLDQRGEA